MIYLLDWGDTLMVDHPHFEGPMCFWPEVTAVPGAKDLLKSLATHHDLYLATGAADSKQEEISQALGRVGLGHYLRGIFCRKNLGIDKGTTAFYQAILSNLNVPADQVVMVGDDYERDIAPAIEVGIKGFWISEDGDSQALPALATQVRDLFELREKTAVSGPISDCVV